MEALVDAGRNDLLHAVLPGVSSHEIRERVVAGLLRLRDPKIESELHAALVGPVPRDPHARELRYLARVLLGVPLRPLPSSFEELNVEADRVANKAVEDLVAAGEERWALAPEGPFRSERGTFAQYLHQPTGLVFVQLPSGRFEMGSPPTEKDRSEDEDRHEVWLSPILLAKHAVSRGVYAAGGGDAEVLGRRAENQDHRQPLTHLSWYEARTFCVQWGWTLPTEAQWEHACRAGTTTRFFFGEELSATHAHFGSRDDVGPVAVDDPCFLGNDFGLVQMHGNVWEWVSDVNDGAFFRKREARGVDPMCYSGSPFRLQRGGSWSYTARFCRSAFRFRFGVRPRLSRWLPGATMHLMLSIGIKTLKNKLSEYVRLVAAGETVLVTDRDKVVAEMVPPREWRSTHVRDALLAEAVKKGWITPALLPPGDPPPRVPVASLKKVLKGLEADREDR